MSEVSPNEKKKCIQCGKSLSWGDKFCSRECKSLSQTKIITLVCCGCGKQFQKMPCLERKANFCSLQCYWETTRREEIRKCKVCGKEFLATGAQIRKGFGVYCSRKCQHTTYPDQIKKVCPQCNKIYWVPPSWGAFRIFCSNKCKNNSKQDYAKSTCKECGKGFSLPMWDLKRGRGNFCTYSCFLKYKGPSTLEEKMEKALKLIGIRFEREVKFKRFHVDFLVRRSNLVIECDGEYWHAREVVKERDRRKERLLKSLGYKVLRFSETTINKLSEKKLSDLVNNYLNLKPIGIELHPSYC